MQLYIKNNKYTWNLEYFFFKLYLISIPFYLWKSGLPQISDAIIISTIVYSLLRNKLSIKISKGDLYHVMNLLYLVVWIFIVNSIASLFHRGRVDFLLNILFYLYNFIITIYVIYLFRKNKEKFISSTIISLFIALLIQVIYIFFVQLNTRIRYTGTFNNPNQLGYYSILTLGLFLFINQKFLLNRYLLGIAVFLSGLLSILSLSNAASISWMLMLVFYMVFHNSKSYKKVFKIILICIGIIAFVTVIIRLTEKYNLDIVNNFIQRIQKTGDKISHSGKGRGYYRIFEYPQYWIFGAGEGFNERFGQRIEFHSTLGNIQVSYGLIGTILFLNFVYKSFKNSFMQSWFIILPIFIYGYSHNGIRSPLFWILLILLYLCFDEKNIHRRFYEKQDVL